MDSKNMQGFEAGGFLFISGEDAALAEKERKQIEYLEKNLDYNNSENILAIYQKLINERTFKTPMGVIYLKHMQKYLLKKAEIKKERVPFIPVMESYTHTPPQKRSEIKTIKEETVRKKKGEQLTKLKFSMILNFILAAAVVAMFWIALKSDTPNMINYKTAIENKYASWEQELTERESIIREKELELKISEK